MLAAAYALKLGTNGETYETNSAGRRREALIAGVATFYTVFLTYAAGLKFLLLSFIIYAPGTILFLKARRERDKRVFTPPELILCVIAIIGAIVGVIGLVSGWISI
jgi:arginine:ornithine antiporter/lysine permease